MDPHAVAGDQAPIQPDSAPTTSQDLANQPNSEQTQDDRSYDLAAREASLYEELTGDKTDVAATSDQPAEPKPDAEKEPPKGDTPATDDQATPEPAQTKPEQGKEATDPADPSDEELNKFHPSARRHVKRLLKERHDWREEKVQLTKEREQDAQAVDLLMSIAQENSLDFKDIPRAAATFGAAFNKRDPQAQARLYDGLVKAGFQPPSAPSVNQDALQKVLDEAEAYGIDTTSVRATAENKPPSSPDQPKAPANPQPSAPPPAAPVHDGIAKLNDAIAQANQRIMAVVGAENAQAFGSRIMATIQTDIKAAQAGDEVALRSLPRLLSMATDAELRQAAQTHKKPPKTVQSTATGAAPALSPLDKREQEWLKRNVSK